MAKLIALAFLLAPALASADPPTSAEAMHTDDCAKATKAHKACALDITGEDITADRPVTTESPMTFRKFADMGSLIRIRHDFIVEILRTAEDL